MPDQLRKSAGASSQPITNPQATGEPWIRIDDSQIVRQRVKGFGSKSNASRSSWAVTRRSRTVATERPRRATDAPWR
jgi:hypothetical protein